MHQNLKQYIKQAPISPGVYQFLSQDNKVLYVGKAKNLYNRLKSYLDSKRHSSRITRMISVATKIETIVTNSEAEALLLECNLIKKFIPKYNILLRDDKSFANILVDASHPFPSIAKHRGKKIINGKYFGPFASNQAIEETINYLEKSFLLRSCSDSEFKRRKKPCIKYQIKRCSAPCVGLVDSKSYAQLIKEVLDFFSGKKADLQKDLAKKMQQYSDNLDYENARIIRDRIKSLSAIQAKQNIHLQNNENIDFIALAKQGNLACALISFFRSGNNYGFKPYFLNIGEDDDDDKIFEAFLQQFYVDQELPESIISCHWTKFLNQKIINPKQGQKFYLLQEYLALAKVELQKKIASQIKDQEMLSEIKNIFDLQKIPQRIEIYDNSHISGQFVVGAFVVAGVDGFLKKAYRKFNIKIDELEQKDDCGFLRQVLQRRFGKIKTIENNILLDLPDLIIIDGGKGQLNTAKQVFEELRINIKFIAMSKGKNRNAGEEFFHHFCQSPQINPQITSLTLQKHSPVMYYLQRLRDEAHRFAIGFNRQKRIKVITKSKLDEIGSIGNKRKKLLLNHFGSADAVAKAAVEDLIMVSGISNNMATKIVNYFGKNS
jgi:excinuclease ABC subunit C